MWRKQGQQAGAARREPRAPRPLDADTLRAMALRYVERYATTRAKLSRYLGDKLRLRGWKGDALPDVEGLVADFARLGYVNDAAFAEARGRTLEARGLGARRVSQTLAADGIDADLRAETSARGDATAAALTYARKKRLGPWGASPPTDRSAREKQVANMLRGGHDMKLARAIVTAESVEAAEALADDDA